MTNNDTLLQYKFTKEELKHLFDFLTHIDHRYKTGSYYSDVELCGFENIHHKVLDKLTLLLSN